MRNLVWVTTVAMVLLLNLAMISPTYAFRKQRRTLACGMNSGDTNRTEEAKYAPQTWDHQPEEVFVSTNKEEKWFRKFWSGTPLLKGWSHRIKVVLEAVPPTGKEQIREWLFRLGGKIGREWAKDNKIRRIDTRMLRQWGETLRRARGKRPDALLRELNRLNAAVDNILSSPEEV